MIDCDNCIHNLVCNREQHLKEHCIFFEKPRPHGEWRDFSDDGYVECPFCEHATTCNDDIEELHFCFFCGASMSANDKQVTGKLNSESKDSHAEYWNSIGEWKEGEAE